GGARALPGGVGGNEEARPGRQVLGRGREGVQAAEVREHARLRQRPAVRGAALLRPVGPRLLNFRCTKKATGRSRERPVLFPPSAPRSTAPQPPPSRSTPRSGRTGSPAPRRCGCRRGSD